MSEAMQFFLVCGGLIIMVIMYTGIRLDNQEGRIERLEATIKRLERKP